MKPATQLPSPVPRSFIVPHPVFGAVLIGSGSLWPYDVTPMVAPADRLHHNLPTGGLQLDIEPRSAEVYVDGIYAGVVRDFSGYYEHLELAAGPHAVMFVASNYEPLIVTVTVAPGQTVSYRGTLTRAYGR